ncbi:hypothetical protein Fcan01_21992 [Folsomia candida]|uniref:Uncharacterized protein n=1 Tax=Folsomia candida TaxID=158441 RepID=A0A226DCZ3_FOLCA|nr:hypothetical protein Fcan01_21992 [Folsomia candida]
MIVCSYFFGLAVTATPIILMYRSRSDELKPLLTAPFEMERWSYERGLRGYVTSRLLVVALLTYVGNVLFGPAYFFVSIWRPCLPFLTTYLFTSHCPGGWSTGMGRITIGIVGRVFSALAEFHYWTILCAIYVSIGWIASFYPGSASIQKMRVIQRELNKRNEEKIKGYREIQLLSIFANNFWKFLLIQILLGAWLVAAIVSLYTVIKLADQIPLEQAIMFALTLLESATMIMLQFKLLAEPCIASKQLFQHRKRLPGGGSQWIRCYIRSCSPYQLKMADGRFFDKTTALIVWQFVVDRVVNCLLM